MDGAAFLETIRDEFVRQKRLAERAAAQVSDADFLANPLGYEQSIGLVMKHVGGNLRSRWRDFLTTDGEKPDRRRDSEFEVTGETRASCEAAWEAGWTVAFAELAQLRASDLDRTVTIRGEPHGVVLAIQRNLAHACYHTGQIVQLARHLAGDAWRTLSIPAGESEVHNARMRERFGDF